MESTMPSNESYRLSTQAEEAFQKGEYRLAEELYLKAAMTVATDATKESVRKRRLWDLAAKRCRRLAELNGGK